MITDQIEITQKTLARLSDEEQRKLLDLLEREKDLCDKAYAGEFEDWCEEFLPQYFEHKVPRFRKDTLHKLSQPGRGKLLAVAEPREHGKTTTYSFAYPLYAICEGHHDFIVIFGATARAASLLLNNIEHEIERNEKLAEAYPFLMPELDDSNKTTAWNDHDLAFVSGQRISARGLWGKTRGLIHHGIRPSLVILDDTEDEEMNETSYRREKYERYVMQSIMNLGGDRGCDVFIVGTILHYDSMLARLTSPGQFDKWWKSLHKAVINWHTKEVLFKEKWSFEKLVEKQEVIGERAFAQEFQQTPSSMLSRIFRHDMLRYFEPSLKGEEWYRASTWTRMAYVDPSMGKQNSDYTGIAIGFRDNHGKIYVWDWLCERVAPDDLGRLLVSLHEKYNFTRIGFEVNATQGVFLNLFTAMGYKLPFEGVNHTYSKKNRIDALEPFVKNGTVLFDPAWERRKDSYGVAMRQLFNYNGRDYGENDDGPDALAGLFTMLFNNQKPSIVKWRR